MAILHPAVFASIVASSLDQLENLSRIIGKVCGSEKAEYFLKACQSLDASTANRILEETVKELTGYGTVALALNVFADKFAVSLPALSKRVSTASSVEEKIKVIDEYGEKIHAVIGGNNHL